MFSPPSFAEAEALGCWSPRTALPGIDDGDVTSTTSSFSSGVTVGTFPPQLKNVAFTAALALLHDLTPGRLWPPLYPKWKSKRSFR